VYETLDDLLDLTMCRFGDNKRLGPWRFQIGEDGQRWESDGLRAQRWSATAWLADKFWMSTSWTKTLNHNLAGYHTDMTKRIH